MIVCGQDGTQRMVTRQGRYWVIVDRATGEALSGGFLSQSDAAGEARDLGAREAQR